jgi:hypothetical protein
MATKLNPKLVNTILEGNSELIGRAACRHNFWFDEDEMYNLFWSEQDKATVTGALQLIRHEQSSMQIFRKVACEFRHEVLEGPVPMHVTVTCTMRGENKYGMLYPATFTATTLLAENAKVRELFNDYMELAFVQGEGRVVLRSLLDDCSTLEQVRYLFPPVTRILRQQCFDELAGTVEEVRGMPRNVPSLNHHTKTMLRFMIQWYARQELLGYLDHKPRLPNEVASTGQMSISLCNTASAVTSDGRSINFCAP